MNFLIPVLNQMICLFAFILLGYALYKLHIVPENAMVTLSKLESWLFIPCLVMGTFLSNFTVEKLKSAGTLLLLSTVLLAVMIGIALIVSKLIYKNDAYLRKVAIYGLTFANFGYMGNAIMSGVFPEIFMEYMVFVIPLWIAIYLWGVPVLLIADDSQEGDKKPTLAQRLKPLLNPMLIAMLIGMLLGITGLGAHIPDSMISVIRISGDCMSPVAMLLTGMTVAAADLRSMLTKPRTYILSAVRLIAIPLLFIAVFAMIPKGELINRTFLICAMASLSMPLGLNTIVVPGGYGKDTTDAAGMALISHTLSIITIPLIFMLFSVVVLK